MLYATDDWVTQMTQIALQAAQAMQQLAPQYKPQAEEPAPDPYVQIEAQKLQIKDAADQWDNATELQKAELEYKSDAEDRASRERIAAMKLAAEAQRSFGGM